MSKGFASVAVVALIIGGGIVTLLNLTGTPTLEPAVPLSPDPAPMRNYDVVAEYPHDPEALTQGLIYRGGFLYESVGGARSIFDQESGTRNRSCGQGARPRQQFRRRRSDGVAR